jgi:hypothetical protein
VDIAGALRAMAEFGWQGDVVLETGSPSKDREADLKRNLTYLRGLL